MPWGGPGSRGQPTTWLAQRPLWQRQGHPGAPQATRRPSDGDHRRPCPRGAMSSGRRPTRTSDM
eukprot:1757764-Lingulodinium_polyedra.AAC.1